MGTYDKDKMFIVLPNYGNLTAAMANLFEIGITK